MASSSDLSGCLPVHITGTTEIYAVNAEGGLEFMVYGVTESGDPKCSPSIGMALEVAGISGNEASEIIKKLPKELRCSPVPS